MTVYRVTAQWQGFPGAPGYSNFHFSGFTGGADADAMRGRVRAFFAEISTRLPAGATITIQPTVEVFEESTGELTGYVDGEAAMSVSGPTSANTYAGPTGAVVNWLTNTVNQGRRVRGRTFLVPLAVTVYEADGTLSASSLQLIRDGAAALTEGDFNSEFVIWSRPRDGGAGVLAPVVGYRVPDMAAVLRSRRD